MTNVEPVSEAQPVSKPKRRERISQLAEVADSVVIKRESSARLDFWLKQINERFEGFGVIAQNEVADFIFRRHAEELSDEELSEIGSEFYDEVHWLNWALKKITQSKIEGGALSLGELIARKNEVTALPNRPSIKGVKREKARTPTQEKTSAQLSGNPDVIDVV